MTLLLFAGAGGPVVLNPKLFTVAAAARGLDEDGFGVRSFSGSGLCSGKDSSRYFDSTNFKRVVRNQVKEGGGNSPAPFSFYFPLLFFFFYKHI